MNRGDRVVILEGKFAGQSGIVNTVLDHDGDWDGTGKLTWKKGYLSLDLKKKDGTPIGVIIPPDKVVLAPMYINREKMYDTLREAYVAFAEKCEEYMEGEDMSPYAFITAWKEEVESRLMKLVEG